MTKNPDEIINHVKEYIVPVERVVHQPDATKTTGNTITDILPSIFAALDIVSRELITLPIPAVAKEIIPIALKAVRDEVTKP